MTFKTTRVVKARGQKCILKSYSQLGSSFIVFEDFAPNHRLLTSKKYLLLRILAYYYYFTLYPIHFHSILLIY